MARRLRLAVGAEGVRLTLPTGVPLRAGQRFVDDNRDWLRTQLARLDGTLAKHPGATSLRNGTHIPYRGRTVPLTIARGLRNRVRFDGGFRIETTRDDAAAVEDLLERWLRAEARPLALSFVDRHGPCHGLVPKALRIKTQRRRWGSCSSLGTVNLNWRLILAPDEVFEYVVVHELGHLREPHHGPAFWRLVATMLPGYQRQRRWLRSHGQMLTLTRPQSLGSH